MTPEKETPCANFPEPAGDQQGALGYILLWLLGVPIRFLFLIYLLRWMHLSCQTTPTAI
jgi:hypothetical protein